MKIGDRVRHEAGWLATVTLVNRGTNAVTVEADEPKMSGEYSVMMFEVVEAGTDD